MEYSELQQKGFAIAKRYEKLPLPERLGIIARTFGCKTASIRTSPCTGKWRGTSDISIVFDNGTSLFIGNRRTPQAKTARVQNECVNDTLAQYNPEIVREAKDRAAAALSKREADDNAVAAQMGLKPYTFLNVELSDGAHSQSGGYMGWYYVTLAVEDKIFGFVETGLKYDIARGVLSEAISRPKYFVAGGMKDSEADFVFNNVGHSSFNGSHQISLSDDARSRAEKRLNERICGNEPQKRPSALDKLAAAKEAAAKTGAEKAERPEPRKSHGAEL
jgi:hypothetical protein